LTGAGGGGCVLTFIPPAFPSAKLDTLTKALTSEGMQCFTVQVRKKQTKQNKTNIHLSLFIYLFLQ